MSDKRSQANFQIFPFMEGHCLQRLEASQTPVGVSAYRRIGVWAYGEVRLLLDTAI